MNEKVKQLAEEAGFLFWDDEAWKPKDAIIDWSSNYDAELEALVNLIVDKCVSICKEGSYTQATSDLGAAALIRSYFRGDHE